MAGCLRAARRFCWAALSLLPSVALSASFYVSPVRVDLSARKPTAALTVRNESEQPVVVQLQTTAWTQNNGKDSTAPTRDLIATPPLFTLPAQGSQIVRLGLRNPQSALAAEQAFRVLLQEVPPPVKPGAQGITMALRLSIPVFVAPAAAKGPALVWLAQPQRDGDILLRVQNNGDAHSQITQLTLSRGNGGKAVAEVDVVSYVLAGQAREWKLKPQQGSASAGERLHLRAETDAGRVDTELELAPR
jgi:fimbrial chaperone protein